MKTAEELFKKYAIKYRTYYNPDDILEFKEFLATEKVFFIRAITEHNNEIKELIDEMEMGEQPELTDQLWDLKHEGYCQALTELRSKI